ncbi:unnamed protein product, partial [Rotaria sordida]
NKQRQKTISCYLFIYLNYSINGDVGLGTVFGSYLVVVFFTSDDVIHPISGGGFTSDDVIHPIGGEQKSGGVISLICGVLKSRWS